MVKCENNSLIKMHKVIHLRNILTYKETAMMGWCHPSLHGMLMVGAGYAVTRGNVFALAGYAISSRVQLKKQRHVHNCSPKQ